jgi:anthranilate synthase
VLLPAVARALDGLAAVETLERSADGVRGRVRPIADAVPEEERSRQPSLFSVVRTLIGAFASPEDPWLGLYGAFGYDLAFQFEPIPQRLARSSGARDLVLYLPDRILVLDPARERALTWCYEFAVDGATTAGLPRTGASAPFTPPPAAAAPGQDHGPGAYPAAVETARQAFARGDLFEVVLSQTFAEPCQLPPSEVFRRLRRANPSPYAALINLGLGEHLVAASPEMYVRVQGRRVETCPISGTIARGRDAVEDARQIQALLNSAKDEAELTMCTDVDRNDKARVCEPGSVRILARRQIELYSRLIHTINHVECRLRGDFDALDAFLSHAWAVTVTGAPKRWAMDFIERHERSARGWYAGAFGRLTFDGNMDTGLTLRTMHIAQGMARVRAGATLLHDSDPLAEDRECRLKASALLAALRSEGARAEAVAPRPKAGRGRRVLLVDHEDSFVHTLADYLRQTGAEITTLRADLARQALAGAAAFDLVVLSPGPGRPSDFATADTLGLAVRRRLPVFGVCLGLQAMVEYCGGALDVLAQPVHGKASVVGVRGGALLRGLPERFVAGRYHSLVARRRDLPADLRVTAETEDGVVMAIEHARAPLAAVQFHPESILSAGHGIGLQLIENVVGLAWAGAGRELPSGLLAIPGSAMKAPRLADRRSAATAVGDRSRAA